MGILKDIQTQKKIVASIMDEKKQATEVFLELSKMFAHIEDVMIETQKNQCELMEKMKDLEKEIYLLGKK